MSDMVMKPIKDGRDNWIKDYSIYFWSRSDPFDVKFEIEKIIGLLLTSNVQQTAKLTYSGSDNPPSIGREIQLRFEAALPESNWYSLHVTAWVPRTWYTKAEFLSYADKAFGYWIHNLQTAQALPLTDPSSPELYDRRVREALDKEARRASETEDIVACRGHQAENSSRSSKWDVLPYSAP